MEKQELFSLLTCAITHDMSVCGDCKKCPGKNFAEIRLNLIKELAKAFETEVPWLEDKENDK